MAKHVKLTPALLRKLVLQEKKKLQETLEAGEEDVADVKPEEVDAADLADSLEKDIDWVKALDIQETLLKRKMKKVSEARKRLKKNISKKITKL